MKRFMVLLAVVCFVLVGCGDDNSNTDASGTSSSSGSPSSSTSSGASSACSADNPPAGKVITIKDFKYGGDLTVKKGETVTVVNADSPTHTLTADEGGSPDTGRLDSGTCSSPITFDTAGTIGVHCEVHGKSAMSANVTVTA